MKKTLGNIRRTVALFLSLVLIFSTCSVSFFAGAAGTYDVASNLFTVTDSQIVAENTAELAAKESDVLNSTALAGNVIVTAVPNEDNTTVSIDAEEKILYAEDFTYGDHTWVPTVATLVYVTADGTEKTAQFDIVDGKCSFECETTSYRMEVSYVLSGTVPMAKQLWYSNAPYYLANSVIGFNLFQRQNSSVNAMADEIALLYKLTTGELGITLKDTSCAYKPIVSLYNQSVANGGKFDFSVSIEEFRASANPLRYVIENGTAVRGEATALCNDIGNIVTDDSGIRSLVKIAMAFSSDERLQMVLDALDYITTVQQNIVEINENSERWVALSNKYIKSDVTDAEYDELYTAVKACIRSSIRNSANLYTLSDITVFKSVELYKATVIAKVDQYKVNVTVAADVVSENSVNDAELTRLEEKKTTLVLDKGIKPDQIIAELEKTGIEAEALAMWDSRYVIGNVNYNRVTSQLPDELLADVEYTVVYTPKEIAVSYEYGGEEILPYGYNLCLESHKDAEKSYDYTVNSQRMWENTVVRVTEPLEISRVERERSHMHTLAEMIAVSAYPGAELSDYEKAVLLAGGVYSSSFKYRAPQQAAGLVEAESIDGVGYVTCDEYDSGLISGAVWVPVSGVAYMFNDTPVAEFEIADGKGSFACNAGFDYVTVKYELDVVDADAEEVNALANLPAMLADEVLSQDRNISKFVEPDALEAICEASGEKIDMLITYGESDYRQATKDALNDVKNLCVDMTKEEQPLYLYDFVMNYMEHGIAYYYRDGVAEMVAEQYDIIIDAVEVVWADPAFQADLNDSIFSQYGGMIRKLRESLSDLEFVPVNELVDRNSEDLSALIGAVMASGKASVHTADKLVLESYATAKNNVHRVCVYVDGVEYRAFVGDEFKLEAPKLKYDKNSGYGYVFAEWIASGDAEFSASSIENISAIIVGENGCAVETVYGIVGDIDGGSQLNAEDLYALVRSIANGVGDAKCDVNFDGAVDARDSVALKRMISFDYDYADYEIVGE